MATDPLALASTPTETPAPALQPGFFDGQLVAPPTPPGAVAEGPIEEVEIAGWGKAIQSTLDAIDIIKKHEASQAGKAPEDIEPFKRSTPRKREEKPNVIDEDAPEPVEVDPATAQVVQTPEGATAAQVPVDAAKIAETFEQYQRFTTDTPFSALDDFNAHKIGSEQDVLAVIAAHSEKYRGQIDDATGGVISQKVTRHMADLVGMNQGKLMKRLIDGNLLRNTSPGELSANMLAARDLLLSSAQESDRLARLVADGNSQTIADAGFESAEEVAVAMQRQFALHAMIQAQVKGAQTEIARTLASFNVPAAGDALRNKAMGDILNAQRDAPSAKLQAALYLEISDPIQRARFLDKSFRAKTHEAIYEVWINSLLSSPVTHTVNLVGNLMYSAGQIPTRTMAAMMGHMRRQGILKGGNDRGVMLGDDAAAMMGYVMAMKDAFKLAGKAFVDPSGEIVAKLEPGKKFRVNAFSAEQFQARGMMGHLVDYAGHAFTLGRLPTRSLVFGDVFFKVMTQRMNLYSEAFSRASREGISDNREFAEAVADYITNPTKEMQEAAIDEGRLVTFQSDLGEYGKAIQTLGTHPVIRWFLPFVKTPANIINRAWDHTPFAMFTTDYKAAIKAGGEKADMARARVAMGSASMAGVALAAHNGLITGGGPSDPKLRANLERQGWQPYSIKFGDTYVSIKRLEPFSTIIGLAADITEIATQGDETKTAEAVAALGMAFSKNVTSKTWMTGLSNLLEAIENPDRHGAKTIESLVRTIIPRGLAQVEKMGDPQKRYIRDLVDAIKQDVPGWSSSLPSKLNTWGEPIVFQSTSLINPFYTSEWKPNPLDTELDRLKTGFSSLPETIPGSGGQLLLDPWEYHDFAELAGKTAKADLEKEIKKDKYDKSNDLVKEMRIKSVYNAAKAKAWKFILNKSRHSEGLKDVLRKMNRQRKQELSQ